VLFYLNSQTVGFLTDSTSVNVSCSTTGNQYLTQQGIAYQTAWDLWQNIMALGIMAIGIMTIAYILLRVAKKLK
jgi:ATP-binding cassette, subfamily G (WHITE), member 2